MGQQSMLFSVFSALGLSGSLSWSDESALYPLLKEYFLIFSFESKPQVQTPQLIKANFHSSQELKEMQSKESSEF